MGLKTKKDMAPFPVSPCVENCYIRKVQYKTGERKDGTGNWEALIFGINHKDSWMNLFIQSVEPTRFEDVKSFEEKKYKTWTSIEKIVSLYVENMVDFRRGLKDLLDEDMEDLGKNFKTISDYIIQCLEDANYTKVPVDVKTNPNREGEAIILPYGKFIRRTGDMTVVMQYENWEEDRMEKLQEQSKYN